MATDVVKLSSHCKALAEHQKSVNAALDATRHDLGHLQTEVNSKVTDLESAVVHKGDRRQQGCYLEFSTKIRENRANA